MVKKPIGDLRTGFTTGACATAAASVAVRRLCGGDWLDRVKITLPRGQEVWFDVAEHTEGAGWAQAGVIKDAGDDPDVTHGCLVLVRAEYGGDGVTFRAGPGVGVVTMPGLPVGVGEPAINPVPRAMIEEAVAMVASDLGVSPAFEITVSIPGGEEIAQKTWNPRLGIEGGLSILGTTGIVRPFSCAAWIASIHRGVDVARATGLTHVCGATGNMSEQAAQAALGLPDHGMLDMGDFAGGMLKYLARHPVRRVTIAGGFGKLTKLAQGAMDLHSGRSQVDFDMLSHWAGRRDLAGANTAAEVLGQVPDVASIVAAQAARVAAQALKGADVMVDVMVVSRDGQVLAVSDVL